MSEQWKYSVLIIDDNEDHIHLCRRALDKEGIKVDWATSRRAALEKFSNGSGNYDVILSDYNLPDATGVEVIAAIQALGVDTPIIMVTGGGSESIAVEAMKAGAFDYIIKKPGYYDKLPSFIEASVNKYRIEKLKTEYGREIARLAYVVENINEGVIIADPSGKITYVNRAFGNIYEYAPGELIGQEISTVIKSAVAQELQSEIFNDSPKGWKGELLMAAKSGEIMPALVSTMAIRTGDGEIISHVMVAMDITERKKVEESLRKLSMAVEQSPESIIITDITGSIEYVNPKFTRLTGYQPDEVIGQNPRFQQSGKTPINIYKELWDTILAGREWRGEFLNKKKNGDMYWELASISPVKDEAGQITHFVAVKEDITDSKMAAEALQAKNRELEIINSITSTLNSSLDIGDKLQKLLADTLDLVGADAGAIYLRNEGRSGELHLSTAVARTDAGKRVSYKQLLPNSAASESIRNPVYRPQIADELFGIPGYGGIVPLFAGDSMMGLMALYDRSENRFEGMQRELLAIASQAGIAVENFRLFKKVQDTGRYLSGIVNESPDPIVTTDAHGIIVSFNKSASRLLKYPAEDVIGKRISSILPEGRPIDLDDRKSYVREFLCKDGTIVTLNVSASKLPGEGDLPGYVITLKDLSSIAGFKVVPITEKAAETDQLYYFEKGFIYLFDRSKHEDYLGAFADLVKHNIQGLCITRHNPKKIRQQYGLEKTPFVWLTGSDQSLDEQCIKPENLTALNATVNKFLAEAKDGVVLLDGAEYLIARNSFESFLKLLHVINDHVMLSNSILQLSLDPAAIDERQYHQLTTEVRKFSERGGHKPEGE
ncbi:PAS domain S-box protein [Methanocella sp. MCL-LM]|uniref:PAS domain S-box protein n=1 Tax=Methanocella sp. MCL-LM TaxID=3412035 RepID=UPI003C76163C